MTNEEITQTLHYLIGSRYVPTVKAYIGELTGRDRIVGPNEPTTLEIDQKRVNVVTEDGVVSRFSFG
ncbi:hypothetical protein BZK31_20950 [Pseudomonas floridensis]|uniref:Peptidase inhibitor I78 family protein n=1 Tax=Pseudomonas floridensis TaxID=1958950 RepID=A0A1X0N361_9PSED|nr:hypothetical protein [Pseudomonas floridensis]ORC57249.1 hypothetical protein BZK31_20950 [Pseudomonas floridensis]